MVLLRSQKVASFSETIQKLEEAKSILNDASRLASSILIEIDTSIRGVYYTTTMIENQTTTVKNHANTLSTKLSSINSSLTTLKNYGNDELEALADKNTISQKEQALADAENTLIKAKRNLDTLIKTQASNLTSKQDEMIQMKNSITLNQKKYEELLAGATREELQSAKNAIESAEISRAKAQLSFKDYQIIAPFDGIVEDIPWIV
jgi:multidrug resistance efflux pump